MKRRAVVSLLVLAACASSPPPAPAPPSPPPAPPPAPPEAPVAEAPVADASTPAPEAPAPEPATVRFRFAETRRGTRVTVSVERVGAAAQTHDFGEQPRGCRVTPMDAPVAGMVGGVECSIGGVGVGFTVWREPGVVRISRSALPLRRGAERAPDVTIPCAGDGPVTLAE